ncbi:MAG: sulfotransferase [Flavobacteriales bacterium]|nr:sulfotransferase [Flavobacteriales bacterium]
MVGSQKKQGLMQGIGNVFIVGNSRSGTTMMLRIMNNHSLVHGINEPHFYGTYWAPADDGKMLGHAESRELLTKLLTRQRDGFFAEVVPGKFDAEVEAILRELPAHADRKDAYATFMAYETRRNGMRIACEKTPQNIFYISELQHHFPGAKVIIMYRDPRAVLLSQKRKWMRKDLGMAGMPDKEVRRLRMNYHPYTIARLWNSSFDAAMRHKGHPDVLEVRFEDLTRDPEGTMRRVCEGIGIPFEPAMLEVPHAGSSSAMDDHSKKGIRTDRGESWKKGLEPAEVAICQGTCGSRMAKLGYEQVPVSPGVLRLAAAWLSFPFKLAGAFVLNLDRMRNMTNTLQRRLKQA